MALMARMQKPSLGQVAVFADSVRPALAMATLVGCLVAPPSEIWAEEAPPKLAEKPLEEPVPSTETVEEKEEAAKGDLESLTHRSLKDTLPFNFRIKAEVGGQTLSGSALQSPTLQKYRDLDGKPTIPFLQMQMEDKQGTQFLEIGGVNMTRTDGHYYLQAGRYNVFQFDFAYDRLPHTFGVNRTTIFSQPSQGIFTLDTSPATEFNAVSSNPTTTERDDVEREVNLLLRSTDLELQVDTARVGLRGQPFPGLQLKAHYSRTHKDGERPFGTVIGRAGSGIVELPAPADELIHEVQAEVEYARDWYQLRFNYDFSLFDNDVSFVQWENVCGTGGSCGNPSGIGRSSVMPDNHAHSFSGSGGATLPWWRSRLTAQVDYSMWRQDDTFLPWTTVPGFTGNTTDAGENSADAEMNTVLADVRFTTRPLPNVTGKLGYRYYQLDNDTPISSFTDVLNSGDETPGASVHNTLPVGYTKQNVTGDVSWRVMPMVTAKAGYEWEYWNRSHREVNTTNEHIVKAGLDVRGISWLLGRAKYSHGVRTHGADKYVPLGANATALPEFRKFTQADRTRDKGEVFLQISPLDDVSVSGSFAAQKDNFFNTTFGVQEFKSYGWSVDVAWVPIERLDLSFGYAHDDYESTQQNCSVGGTVCAPATEVFFTKPRDILDSLHAGLNLLVIPDRMDLSVTYRYTYGRSKIGSGNVPGGGAVPATWPTIKNTFHTVNVDSQYHVTSQWTLKLNYVYERYLESDFTTDGVPESLANFSFDGFSTAGSRADVRTVMVPVQHPNYEAHIVAFSTVYTFN